MENKIIEVKNLKKYFRVHKKEAGFWGSMKSLIDRKYFDAKAVDGVSFEINESELVGFIGPNGAGKTTTLKVLSGLLYPSSGDVRVLGFNPSDRKSEFQKQFALVMGQKNQLWWDLPAWESFVLNKEIYEITDQQFKKTVDELTEILDIKGLLNIAVRKLSLGQRMKVELIAALLHAPKVLFLDEPTVGLDVVAQKKLRDFIKEYNQRYHATIILTSHYMGDVKELCKRVVIINKGLIIFDGSLESIVDKFAPHKVIKVDFEKEVSKERLEEIGEVKEFENLSALIHIPKNKATAVASKLLDRFPVADLTIEEPSIEDIIRYIFNEGRI